MHTVQYCVAIKRTDQVNINQINSQNEGGKERRKEKGKEENR
jgi:hypothetical protein